MTASRMTFMRPPTVATLLLLPAVVASSAEPVVVNSPGGSFVIKLSVGEGGRRSYRVERSGHVIIEESGLDFELEGGVDWTRGFRPPESIGTSEHDATCSPVRGERSTIRDHCRTATARFRRQDGSAGFDVEAHAYDEPSRPCSAA